MYLCFSLLSALDCRNCGVPPAVANSDLWNVVFTVELYLYDYELSVLNKLANITLLPSHSHDLVIFYVVTLEYISVSHCHANNDTQ